jgi:hypothetical protein
VAAAPAPIFPVLALPVPGAAPRAAEAHVRPGEPAPAGARPVAPAGFAGDRPAPTPGRPELPRLVDEVVGELERRIHAQRERKGWLA